MVGPEAVIAAAPAYGKFLAGQVARHGRHHPIVAAEYFLEPADGSGGLFPPRRRRMMAGVHPRQSRPNEGALVVVTLDVAGVDEGAGGAQGLGSQASLQNPGRDYTVATAFELEAGEDGYTYLARDVFVDQGSPHFAASPGQPSLAEQLAGWLSRWQAAHIVADATGVGAGLVDWLQNRFGKSRVTAFNFSRRSKAQLGADFLTLVETGRFQYWTGDETEPLSDGWWFWVQCRHCIFEVSTGGVFERDLRWWVPDSARVDVGLGSMPVHDDRLVSAALAGHVDRLIRLGKLGLGVGRSVVVRPIRKDFWE
jgi:hypothetical protein